MYGDDEFTEEEILGLVAEAFRDFDANKDGFLALEEFAKNLSAWEEQPSSAAEVKEMFDILDENKDGKLSPAEHEAFSEEFLYALLEAFGPDF